MGYITETAKRRLTGRPRFEEGDWVYVLRGKCAGGHGLIASVVDADHIVWRLTSWCKRFGPPPPEGRTVYIVAFGTVEEPITRLWWTMGKTRLFAYRGDSLQLADPPSLSRRPRAGAS